MDHQARTSHAAILEISRCVQGIPQVLGYSWEGGLNTDSRPISLLDMLGQSIRLPLELCSTWEVRSVVYAPITQDLIHPVLI